MRERASEELAKLGPKAYAQLQAVGKTAADAEVLPDFQGGFGRPLVSHRHAVRLLAAQHRQRGPPQTPQDARVTPLALRALRAQLAAHQIAVALQAGQHLERGPDPEPIAAAELVCLKGSMGERVAARQLA